MRLINCSTLKFQEFIRAEIPPHTILSHTWEKEEVLFGDLCNLEGIMQKKGSQKVIQTCRLAIQDGYEYAWIDTCCIDKSSSAELTEAISSMFNWYKRSSRCYVYLGDFHSQSAASEFGQCRWFTRGWTLQELVAPSDIHFYDKDWRYFGSKSELGAALSTITGIERLILNGNVPLFAISVAKKMSWASQRETTREEDHAYCLLGIFGISMPLVYGEGLRAFTRLQEEIIKETNDLTLFAWQARPMTPEITAYRGILALSPREFANAGTIMSNTNQKNNPEFAMTNKGLRIHIPLSCGPGSSVVMSLSCYRRTSGNEAVGIYLVDIGGGIYARDLPQQLASYTTAEVWRNETIYIMKHVNDARYL
jgi:hypothetical protein